MSEFKYNEYPYFIIPSAIIVEGRTRILLTDTERKQNYLLPIKYKLLVSNPFGYTLQEARKSFDIDEDEFSAIIQFLQENDLIYYSKNRDYYISLPTAYDYPAEITNGIVDIGPGRVFTPQMAAQFMEINCFHLQVRYMRHVLLLELEKLLELLNNIFLKSLELAISWNESITEDLLVDLARRYLFLNVIICYSCPEALAGKVVEISDKILYFVKTRLSPEACGIVSISYFTSNVTAISEGMRHNSCLNRKISIDMNGNIKKCPSMNESYGSIETVSLKSIIEIPRFKQYWNISKDYIHVCKECEFRYVCTDCRAYLEDPDDILSKPLKCGYDPYTGEWSEWSTNPLKQKAIDFYGMRDLIEKI